MLVVRVLYALRSKEQIIFKSFNLFISKRKKSKSYFLYLSVWIFRNMLLEALLGLVTKTFFSSSDHYKEASYRISIVPHFPCKSVSQGTSVPCIIAPYKCQNTSFPWPSVTRQRQGAEYKDLYCLQSFNGFNHSLAFSLISNKIETRAYITFQALK